jgi:hypothetical protein
VALRWIPYSRVSMQRAGVLSAIVVAASDSQATSLEGISRSYTKLIRRSVAVPSMEGEVILQYLRKQRLWKRYGTLKQAEEWPEDAQVEQQDYWLADPAVPSATGAVTDDVIDEPPQLAAALRLIRDQNYTRTDRGRALLAVLEGDVQTLREG